ncbi:MAG: ATP-binding cassette domain-containing protein [Thermodesulfobacteriota bacterium]|nr:ATP-binding cassette domain-containing protein [Thermodesulfobacteriota bacterium]
MIQVENLTKYYSDFCAVDNITLEIKKGEILGLLGPNGAGKTTILRMLTGFFKPTSGTIDVEQNSILTDSLNIKKMIGYLPESAPLYHNMLVYDYLEYVAKVKGVEKEKRMDRLRELSDLCGLSGIMHKSIEELSKGLKQRVGLAHAMMTDPEILILDEPTSGLDPNQIAEIRKIIRRIGRRKTIVFSTHILSEAEATCDRIVILNRGRVVADDTTANLTKGAYRGACIRLSLCSAEEKEVTSLLKEIDPELKIVTLGSDDSGAVSFDIKSSSSKDFRKDIYLKIRETDWIILEMSRESHTLEKIFQELTMEN